MFSTCVFIEDDFAMAYALLGDCKGGKKGKGSSTSGGLDLGNLLGPPKKSGSHKKNKRDKEKEMDAIYQEALGVHEVRISFGKLSGRFGVF